jgi:hypothetical protein
VTPVPGLTAIEFVVTDLDGTLWSYGGQLPAATREALGELERRAVPVLAATARRSSAAGALFSLHGLDLPALLLNGALGRGRRDRAIFYQVPFSLEDANSILETFCERGVTPCVNFETAEWDVVSGLTPSAGSAYLDGVGQYLKLVDNLDELCGSLRVFGFSVAGVEEPTILRNVEAKLLRLPRPPEVVLSPDGRIGGWTLVASPFGVTKWSGVEAFARVYGLDSSKALAIGEGDNDVELLAHAAIGVAMGHATRAAKASATVVLPGGVESWAMLLDHI